jgi:hypothetical protein
VEKWLKDHKMDEIIIRTSFPLTQNALNEFRHLQTLCGTEGPSPRWGYFLGIFVHRSTSDILNFLKKFQAQKLFKDEKSASFDAVQRFLVGLLYGFHKLNDLWSLPRVD